MKNKIKTLNENQFKQLIHSVENTQVELPSEHEDNFAYFEDELDVIIKNKSLGNKDNEVCIRADIIAREYRKWSRYDYDQEPELEVGNLETEVSVKKVFAFDDEEVNLPGNQRHILEKKINKILILE